MAFPQTIIAGDLVSGLIGEVAFDSPTTAAGVTAAVDVPIGVATTYTSLPNETVSPGGTGVFAGISINPKTNAVQAISAVTSDVVPAGHQLEVLKEGEVYVQLSNAAAIGDLVYFTNTTGALSAGTAATGQTQIAGATVYRHATSAEIPRLAVIRIKQ